jgi:hypothetical protein
MVQINSKVVFGFNYVPHHESTQGSAGTDIHIYTFLTSAIVGDKQLASYPNHPRECLLPTG